MNDNGYNSKLIQGYVNPTKLIILAIIFAIVGIGTFGCQSSPPTEPKTQALPVTQPDAQTASIDPTDIPTAPPNLPDDPLLSSTLPENETALPIQPESQVDVPNVPEIKTSSPRKSQSPTVLPKQPKTQPLSQKKSETESFFPEEVETESFLPKEPKTSPLSPDQPEIQPSLPKEPKITTLSPTQPDNLTVLLTPPDTQVALLRPPKLETSRSSILDIKNLPDGNYFYGESPDSNTPGKRYMIFKKKGDLIIGQEYLLQTDNSQCFRGTANSSQINNVKTAYFEQSGDGLQWAFRQMDSIGTKDLHQLGFEKAPDFATQHLQECIQVFTEEKISMR